MVSASSLIYTAQKTKLSIKEFFSKCDQICRKLGIRSHLLNKSLMGNFIFCAVLMENYFVLNLIDFIYKSSTSNGGTVASRGGALKVLLQ